MSGGSTTRDRLKMDAGSLTSQFSCALGSTCIKWDLFYVPFFGFCGSR